MNGPCNGSPCVLHGDREVHGITNLNHVFVNGFGQFELGWLEHPHRSWRSQGLTIPIDLRGVGDDSSSVTVGCGWQGEGLDLSWVEVKGFNEFCATQADWQDIGQVHSLGNRVTRILHRDREFDLIACLNHVAVNGLGQFELGWLEHPHTGWRGQGLTVPIDFGGVGDRA